MGKIRVFSIKVALATMCAGKLMDKLRCKYGVILSSNVQQAVFALMHYKYIYITKGLVIAILCPFVFNCLCIIKFQYSAPVDCNLWWCIEGSGKSKQGISVHSLSQALSEGGTISGFGCN